MKYIFSILKDISGLSDFEKKKKKVEEKDCDYLSSYQHKKLIRVIDRVRKIEVQVSSNADLRNK